MNTKFNFGPETDRIVYVRPVEVASLPDEIRVQAGDADTIYAVHDSDGAQLAFVANRRLAFALARDNDMTPVNVH